MIQPSLKAIIFIGLMILAFSCKKESVYRNGAPGELPPETQTGANTFGCLVNGKVWKPTGKLFDNVLDLSYDPTFNGGTMSIKAKRFTDSSNISVKEYMDIAMGELSKEGIYSLNTSAQNAVLSYVFFNIKGDITLKSCGYNYDNITSEGVLNITRLDTKKGFISGTFECTLSMKSRNKCDTTYEASSDNIQRVKYITCQRDCDSVVHITQGRFDLKM